MSTITDTIIDKIKSKKKGWVFTPNSFLSLGSRAAVDQVLSRLTKSGMIRRLDRGVYDYPRQHKLLGTLSPNPNDVATALADGAQLSPSGAAAANILGLSTQVPAKPVFLTNGTKRSCTVNGNVITLKPVRASTPLLRGVSDKTNLFIQAISYLGKSNIDDLILDRCALILSDDDMKKLFNNASRLPSWITDIIHVISDIKYGQIQRTA